MNKFRAPRKTEKDMQSQMRNRKIRVPAAFVEAKGGGVFECNLKIYSFSATALQKTLNEGARELPLLWRGESIGSVRLLFEGSASGVLCIYHPAPTRLALEAVEACIRQGCATGIELDFDVIKYRPGQLKEVRLRAVVFVRALAGVWPAARADTFSENIPGGKYSRNISS